MSAVMTEDTLVQRTTADYLHDELGWESIYAYNEEIFGPELQQFIIFNGYYVVT